MLDQIDKLIRKLLLRDVDGLDTDDQVGFQPPDSTWRSKVVSLGKQAVNVYLVDLRENPALRDPEWTVEVVQNTLVRKPGAMRVDAHYLISAWSPASETPAIEPAFDEHALIYRVIAALARANPLNPSKVYPEGSADLNDVPELIRRADLPVQVVGAEGWPKLTEFWGTMGTNPRIKPAVWYRVTVPVAMEHRPVNPLVTTRIIEFRQDHDPTSAEQWLQIGGTVKKANAPVEGALVTVTGAGGTVIGGATTAKDGRFTVGGLSPGRNTIHAEKPADGTANTTVALPGKTGDYDVSLT